MKYAPLILLLLVQITSAKETWENDGPIGRDPPHNPLALLKPAGRIDVFLATERVEKEATPPRVAYPKAIERPTNPTDWPLALNIKQGWRVSYGRDGFIAFSGKRDLEHGTLFFSNWRFRVESLAAFWERMTKEQMHDFSKKGSIGLSKSGFKSIWVDGAEFKGKAALFDRTDGRVSTIFLLSNGQAIWRGGYCGPESQWEEALDILLSLKQKGRTIHPAE